MHVCIYTMCYTHKDGSLVVSVLKYMHYTLCIIRLYPLKMGQKPESLKMYRSISSPQTYTHKQCFPSLNNSDITIVRGGQCNHLFLVIIYRMTKVSCLEWAWPNRLRHKGHTRKHRKRLDYFPYFGAFAQARPVVQFSLSFSFFINGFPNLNLLEQVCGSCKSCYRNFCIKNVFANS